MRSGTVEDYLKAIYELQVKEGRAKTSMLAEKLGVTAGSVTDMLRRLSESSPRLLTYKHHYGVQLTAKGEKAALDVIRRHRLLETFLHQVLGLTWDEVHREAEILEHHISERVTEAISQVLEHPRFDPHGEPIPSKQGDIPTVSQKRLSDIEVGTAIRIVRVRPFKDGLLSYLDEIGIGIDTTGTVIAKAPLEGPVTLRVDQGGKTSDHTLGRGVTDHLFVDVL